jgi:predicted Zn-dependent peptidase
MADLDAASLTDVRKWFTDHYAPNNVVLVLAGDIDCATARPMVERWFGDIPRGPDVRRAAPAVTLARRCARNGRPGPGHPHLSAPGAARR